MFSAVGGQPNNQAFYNKIIIPRIKIKECKSLNAKVDKTLLKIHAGKSFPSQRYEVIIESVTKISTR